MREAPVLASNLAATIANMTRNDESPRRSLASYDAQSDFLALISTGDESAVGCKFGVGLAGWMLWKLKVKLDTDFVKVTNDAETGFIL